VPLPSSRGGAASPPPRRSGEVSPARRSLFLSARPPRASPPLLTYDIATATAPLRLEGPRFLPSRSPPFRVPAEAERTSLGGEKWNSPDVESSLAAPAFASARDHARDPRRDHITGERNSEHRPEERANLPDLPAMSRGKMRPLVQGGPAPHPPTPVPTPHSSSFPQ